MSLKGAPEPGMANGHWSVRYECFSRRKLRDSCFSEPECLQGPAAFSRRLGNIQPSVADLLYEIKDNHVLSGIVLCTARKVKKT